MASERKSNGKPNHFAPWDAATITTTPRGDTMRYTTTVQRVQVIGFIWQPGVGICAMQKELSAYDMDNIEDVRSRESVEDRVSLLFGDFQSIEDFRADFHVDGEHIVHEWKNGEESEMLFHDAMYPSED
jgi:hypothetical protein